MKVFLYILFISTFAACTVSKDPAREKFRNLQKGRLAEDTSYVYALPYETGRRYWMVQGYYSSFSHKNRAAIDFKMKKGTKILAARGGKVVRTKADGDKGGLKSEYRAFGNHVVIEHDDGTRAGYWHLQKDGVLVKIGDVVKTGDVIGLSGQTGYSAFPHLHFVVWKSHNGRWQHIPTRFQTRNGPKYLRPLRKYKKQ